MHDWIKTNQGVATCIATFTLFLGLHITVSDWAFQKLRDGFYLGSFTLMAVFTILVCALALMVDSRRDVIEEDMARTTWRDWVIAAGMMGLCYVYFELAWNIDFLLVTPVMMSASIYILGIRPARSAIIAGVVITVVIYVLFRLIGIHLPTGVLGL